MVVEGEPGIGKTALLEAALAEVAGVQVLLARCAEAEAGLAFAGLVDLLGRVYQADPGGVGVAAAPGA
jgi:predicted ATPase